jgi:hypothetical protein
MGNMYPSSPEMFFISAGLFSEFLAMWLYARYKFRLRKLAGTGRRHDIDLVYRWQSVAKISMVAVPALLYWLWSIMYVG